LNQILTEGDAKSTSLSNIFIYSIQGVPEVAHHPSFPPLYISSFLRRVCAVKKFIDQQSRT